MHKILTSITRCSGTQTAEDSVIVSSQPNVAKAVETGKVMPVAMKFYELESLPVEERGYTVSDELKHKIENKGFKHFNPIVGGRIFKGFTANIELSSMNNLDAKQLQILSSQYLENTFGYWNVYEMDYEKIESDIDISGDGTTGLNVYEDYSVLKIKIENSEGTTAGITGLTIKAGDENILINKNIESGAVSEFTVYQSFTETKAITVTAADWSGNNIDIYIKHIIT